MIASLVIGQAVGSLDSVLSAFVPESSNSHWSIYLSHISALAMTVSAVAFAIFGNYPMCAACSLSVVTHLIAGHYLKTFLIYRDFEVANENLQQRVSELQTSANQLQATHKEFEQTKNELEVRLVEHDKERASILRARQDALNQLEKVNKDLERIVEVQKNMETAKTNIVANTDKTEAHLNSLTKQLEIRTKENQELNGSLIKINDIVSNFQKNLISKNDEINSLKALLDQKSPDKKQMKALNDYNEGVINDLDVSNKAVEKLLEKCKVLKTENLQLKEKIKLQEPSK